jgi:hypothetical protein
VAIIRGEWDSLATDADARWLFDTLHNSGQRRDVKIPRATHLILFRAVSWLRRRAESAEH